MCIYQHVSLLEWEGVVCECGSACVHPQTCKLCRRVLAHFVCPASMPWLLPLVPGGSALLVHREINTLQTSCLVGCGSVCWPPDACSCHGNQSRSVSVCHCVPGLGQLWAKATVVRAGQGEERRGLGDPPSLLFLTPSWGLFSAFKHEGRSPLSDNWDQNKGPSSRLFLHT